MHEGITIHSSLSSKLLRDYRNILSLPLDNIIIKVENGFSSDEGVSEDELAIIVVAIRMYRDVVIENGRKTGNGNGHNNAHTNSQWLTNWIFETTNNNVHSLLKHNGNGLNHRIQLVDEYITSWNIG